DELSTKMNEQEQGDFRYKREKAQLLIFSPYATAEQVVGFDKIADPFVQKYCREKQNHHQGQMRHLDFNQGVDARLVFDESKAVIDQKMRVLATTAIRPLRIAFDQYAFKDKYIRAIKSAAEHGIKNLSNYMLYNFKDTPTEFWERLKINIYLCEELQVSIYSFPMKYIPILGTADDEFAYKNRDFLGEHWCRKFIRAIQAVLNSTKGKIGRGKDFFEAAFGKDLDGFFKILYMPEAFIVNRAFYDADLRQQLGDRYQIKGNEQDLTNQWWKDWKALSPTQLQEIEPLVKGNKFENIESLSQDKDIRKILRYYTISRGDKDKDIESTID
ncbi:MAG: hypothetical protein FWD76_05980, partial [Firmicutes bacterium]|nr:hypothetical protein [Bacillota bacterium]